MKSYTGDFIWSAVENGRAEEKFYEKEYERQRKSDGRSYDAWNAEYQKLYRAVNSVEQSALNYKRRKGIVEACKENLK